MRYWMLLACLGFYEGISSPGSSFAADPPAVVPEEVPKVKIGIDQEWERQLSAFDPEKIVQISGIYPHLCAYNRHGECGIGAVVPWAGRLWWITYPPHMRQGSQDKLYSIDESLKLTVHPESVGGTHAARMIHEPSGQLLIGPYAISEQGQIRALDVKAIPGRYTAWAAHLQQPEEKAYLFDMEGPVWEVDVNTLAAKRLFLKPAPGWHGKGAYTGGNRLIIANNGESSAAGDIKGTWEFPLDQWPRGGENAGVLSEYDGEKWNIVLRRQFVEVTGPGGIQGNASPDDPVYAMGWDDRSVLLLVLEDGKWNRFRIPKASHAMDPKHGWYTEWPRIRPISETQSLMCMHGMFFNFPRRFSAKSAMGIRPIASHLRYVPDFCLWNDQLVLAADDTSILQNPMAGQSQSNLWFGSLNEVLNWGSGSCFGGPWLGDKVQAGVPSDPYLFAGFRKRLLHLAAGDGPPPEVRVEIDRTGQGQWESLVTLTVPSNGYLPYHFPDDTPGEWIRLTASRDVTISGYFHYGSIDHRQLPGVEAKFTGLRPADDPGAPILVRPAAHNRTLQVLVKQDEGWSYFELNETLDLQSKDDPEHRDEALKLLALKPQVTYDEASALIVSFDKRRYRLPVVDGIQTVGRDVREVQSERSLSHIGNIFYEVPRGDENKEDLDFRRMRPVSSHEFAIQDFCSWRGLLVLAGIHADHPDNSHYVSLPDQQSGLWLGCVDELWQLGKPVGVGGPWKNTSVTKGVPSDPYLMTGFDRKTLTLSHTSNQPVKFQIQVDYSNRDFWKTYRIIEVPAGETVTFEFPSGYSAHWIRFVIDQDCEATAQLRYE